MKKALLILLLMAGYMSQAQTITPGYQSFAINGIRYPLNSVIMNIRATDSTLVELDFAYSNGLNPVIIAVQKFSNYKDGRTGVAFASIGALKSFYDSFMVSTPATGGGGGSPTGSAGGDLTGSTYPNPTVGVNKITYAKMQRTSAKSRLIGATAADTTIKEIKLGTGLSFSNDTLNASGGDGTIIMGQFTATPDDATVAFTTTVPAGYSYCVVTLETAFDPFHFNAFPFVQSCSISGTTLTVKIYACDLGTTSVEPPEAAYGDILVNYVISK